MERYKISGLSKSEEDIVIKEVSNSIVLSNNTLYVEIYTVNDLFEVVLKIKSILISKKKLFTKLPTLTYENDNFVIEFFEITDFD